MDDIFRRWIMARWIKKILHKSKTIKTGLKVYMDDMLIYTEVEKPGQPSEEELEAHWEAVSDILRSLEANVATTYTSNQKNVYSVDQRLNTWA